jgi:hypothetical protein
MSDEYPYNQPEFPGSRSRENPSLERVGPTGEERARRAVKALYPILGAALVYEYYPYEWEEAGRPEYWLWDANNLAAMEKKAREAAAQQANERGIAQVEEGYELEASQGRGRSR